MTTLWSGEIMRLIKSMNHEIWSWSDIDGKLQLFSSLYNCGPRIKWAMSHEKVPSNMHKCVDFEIPVHAQSIIPTFALHSYILWYHMILLADSEGPDQAVDVQAELGLRCPHMPKDTFSHGAAQVVQVACLPFHSDAWENTSQWYRALRSTSHVG